MSTTQQRIFIPLSVRIVLNCWVEFKPPRERYPLTWGITSLMSFAITSQGSTSVNLSSPTATPSTQTASPVTQSLTKWISGTCGVLFMKCQLVFVAEGIGTHGQIVLCLAGSISWWSHVSYALKVPLIKKFKDYWIYLDLWLS